MRIRTPEDRQTDRLRSKYGISLKDKLDLLAAQGGRCAICGRTDAPRWEVDHCHRHEAQTGAIKIRGILCGNCNSMLGMAKDSVETLEAAIRYLKPHTPRTNQ